MKHQIDIKRISELAEQILHHKNLYYKGVPVISDEAFDRLEDELKSLSPNHPVLAKIGGELAPDLPKIPHLRPMLSLSKTYEEKDLIKWIDGRPVVATFKIDGNSLSLVYEKNQLIIAKSRGNGAEGEDVLSKARWIDDCLPMIKDSKAFTVEIRGELYCGLGHFERLKTAMAELQLEEPTSPRNIIAGILGRKQETHLARFFNFFAFDVLLFDENKNELFFASEEEKMHWLKESGFRTPDWKLITSEEDVFDFLELTKDLFEKGSFSIDGAVFTLNDTSLQQKLGSNAHHPKYKKSFKWHSETKEALIQKILWFTSRSGIVTPVAQIEPVFLSQATLHHVTLHNAAYVEKFNLKAGDKILIVRSGEVIPKFLKVTTSTRGLALLPSSCPCCGGMLEKLSLEDGSAADTYKLVCGNRAICTDQIIGRLSHWVKAVNIENLSEKRLGFLVHGKKVLTLGDLYRITEQDLLEMPLTKEKMAQKLFSSIQSSKSLPLLTFLNGLGLEGVGLQILKELLKHFNSLDEIFNFNTEHLLNLEGIGHKKIAKQFFKQIHSMKDEIDDLLSAGVQIKTVSLAPKASNGLLKDKTFALSGTMSQPREAIAAMIEAAGGHFVSAISKNVDYLVLADPSSHSSKAEKARAFGIIIIGEEQLRNMLSILQG